MDKNKHIQNELADLQANKLKGLKSQLYFRDIPTDYFSQMQEEVLGSISIDLKNKGFSKITPSDEYFDKMQEEVLQKLGSTKVIALSPIYKILAIAASFLVLFSFGYLLKINNEKINSDFVALESNLTNDDINFILENYSTEEDFQFIESHEEIEHLQIQIQEEELDEKLIEDIMTDEDIDYLDELM
jgi:hypothetical protein